MTNTPEEPFEVLGEKGSARDLAHGSAALSLPDGAVNAEKLPEWAALIAAEFAKPQFMTSTADSGRYWITFRFDSDDARERCHALEDAFRAAGRAINGPAT